MANKPIVIYHNARCSKSRSACEIIAALGIEAEVTINNPSASSSKPAIRIQGSGKGSADRPSPACGRWASRRL